MLSQPEPERESRIAEHVELRHEAFKREGRTVYKDDAESGSETLVRGVDVVGPCFISKQTILAASDTPVVLDGSCGGRSAVVPVSVEACSAPSPEVELHRSARSLWRPSLLPSLLSPTPENRP